MSQTWSLPVAQSTNLDTARAAWNNAAEALRTCHSGSSAPSSTVAYMFWADTGNGWLMQRNSGNTAWIYHSRLGDVPGAGFRRTEWLWLADDSTSVTGLTIPAPHIVWEILAVVHEAFDSDGTDLAEVGRTGDTDAYATAFDVSTTGVKTPSAGAELGVVSTTARELVASYAAGGSAATTGKLVIGVDYQLLPAVPA